MSNIVSVEINTKQIELAIEKFSTAKKIKLMRKLEKETRQIRWDNLICKLRQQFAKNPISDDEITKICEQVRQKRYEKANKNTC